MRKIKQNPKIGDRRIITKFLFFPKTLPHNSVMELRWWERANIVQEYGDFGISYNEPPTTSWEDICWGED